MWPWKGKERREEEWLRLVDDRLVLVLPCTTTESPSCAARGVTRICFNRITPYSSVLFRLFFASEVKANHGNSAASMASNIWGLGVRPDLRHT